MDNATKIYLLTRLDFLQGLFTAIAFVVAAVYLMYYFFHLLENGEMPERKSFFTTAIVVAFFTLLAGLTPTRNDMILIWAGGKTMDYVQSDTSLAKMPYQTTTIISKYLDKAIKELDEAEK